jgi:hypothetical protein
MTFSFVVSATGANVSILQIDVSANSTARALIQIRDTGVVRIYGNEALSVSASTTATVSIDTLYYGKAYWNKTSGTYNLEFNQTGTFDGSGTDYASNTNGDTGVEMGGLRVISNVNTYDVYVDNILIVNQ